MKDERARCAFNTAFRTTVTAEDMAAIEKDGHRFTNSRDAEDWLSVVRVGSFELIAGLFAEAIFKEDLSETWVDSNDRASPELPTDATDVDMGYLAEKNIVNAKVRVMSSLLWAVRYSVHVHSTGGYFGKPSQQ